MTSEHAADQAGGEVVYASDGPADGVAPAAFPMRFPIGAKQTAIGDTAVVSADGIDKDGASIDKNASAVLDEGSQTTAVQAFEVFSGKLYHPGSGVQGGSAASTSKQYETPLERFGRLQRELAELEEQAVGGGGDTNDYEIDKDDWNRTVSDLQTRLQQTQQKYSWPVRQEQLTAALQKTVQEGEGAKKIVPQEEKPVQQRAEGAMSVVGYPGGLGQSSPQRKSSLQRAAQSGEEKGGGATTAVTTASAASALPSLDERMRRLELAVGSTSSTSLSSSTWSERLRLMEQAVQKLDSAKLDMAVARSKVIRQDLEAASKARNKLLTSGRSAGADAATIQSLHTAYVDLQGMAQYLSPLAVRLSVLARQHQDQATHGQRLLAAEETAKTMQQQLTSVELSVQQLQEGWKVNAATMETNIKALDARMVMLPK
jgi:dynactin-2